MSQVSQVSLSAIVGAIIDGTAVLQRIKIVSKKFRDILKLVNPAAFEI